MVLSNHRMAKLSEMHLFQYGYDFLVESSFCKFGGYLKVLHVIYSADLPFGVCVEPHNWVIGIVENYSVRNIEDELLSMHPFTRLVGKKLVEVEEW